MAVLKLCVPLHRFKLSVKGTENVHGKDNFLGNDDIRPLALKDRTWTNRTYFTFWFSAIASGMPLQIPLHINLSNAPKIVARWYSSSSAQALGLSMWESLACSVGGHIILGVILFLNGRPGAVYSVGYPILCRASFGIYGAWW
jgi:NCS1 family nucleobase:cation symporter-1